MFGLPNASVLKFDEEYHSLEDYHGRVARWCPGCGDNGILTAVQRLCRDEQLPPEKTVFVSGIGCAARFPHYMKTYGFHGLHGRALPTAQGIKIRRPDLHVFVNMGDGDCCSIGAGHWLHAIRMNMNMTALLHDNSIYGLTKKQASPTTPQGMITNTTPRGVHLQALNPLSVTLGVTNASFVAQVVEWLPDLLYDVIRQAYQHRGFSFVRIIQRCPHFMTEPFETLLANPDKLLLLKHESGMRISDVVGRMYKSQTEHDPADLNRARELVEDPDRVPIGILYRNEAIPRYDELRRPERIITMDRRRAVLDEAFDSFGIFPQDPGATRAGGGGQSGDRENRGHR
jgi:2-oxoglutarate ferredoxin oxidoreductase subunit beta